MDNVTIYGEHDDNTLAQMRTCMETGNAACGVLCADGHLGYAHPIGGVVGYREQISISGVGFDIACGNMAVKLDTRADDIRERIPTILNDIQRVISFGVGRKNDERVEHVIFDESEWLWASAGVEDLKPLAQAQLGTVGSGNHYVDIFEDLNGWVWIGVHFGSRGLGHKITTKALKRAGAKDGMLVPPALLGAHTDEGQEYIAGIMLAGNYAYAGRQWVVERVRQIIGGYVQDTVHNHHNFVWQETHNDEPLWVVRKGSTPAWPGQRGFVGGSMGECAVIIEGIDTPLAKASMYSTVHGAGRVMSRTQARGKFVRNPDTGKKERQDGLIRHDEWQAWMRMARVELRGGGLDEAPQAYRRLPGVLAAHHGTIVITESLKPMGVVMAGGDTRDPYGD